MLTDKIQERITLSHSYSVLGLLYFHCHEGIWWLMKVEPKWLSLTLQSGPNNNWFHASHWLVDDNMELLHCSMKRSDTKKQWGSEILSLQKDVYWAYFRTKNMKQLCYIEIKRLLVRHMEFVLKEWVRRDAWYYFVPPYMKRDVSSQQSLATKILESSLVYHVS